MHQKEEFERKLCSLKDKLCAMIESGSYQLDSEEGGAIVDEIKDLVDAEKNLWKACYYKTIVEAMKEEKEHSHKMGYDNWRYSSSGRYAPKGHGSYSPVSGYMMPRFDFEHASYPNLAEMVDRMGYDDIYYDMNSMSYSGSGRGRSESGSDNRSGDSNRGSSNSSYYGYSYDRFSKSRKNYEETKSQKDKDEMNQHANEHIMDTLDTMRDIWKDADPQLRKKMKSELTSLVQDMN